MQRLLPVTLWAFIGRNAVDLSNLMKMANQVKEQMQNAKEIAQQVQVTGESGGGMVKVVMNGQHDVLDITLDSGMVKAENAALIEDLLKAAVNQASVKARAEMKRKMGDMAADFGVDFSKMGFPLG